MSRKNIRFIVASAAALALVGSVLMAAYAQDVLPRPEKPLPAQVERTWQDSKPAKIEGTKAPANAPNIVIVLLDDVGFGAAGTFGGPAPTPTLDRLAQQGLRYNAFHTTALCSPTRAALLTGAQRRDAARGANDPQRLPASVERSELP